MASSNLHIEDLDDKVPEAVRMAVREAYLHHFQEGRVLIISKDGQLLQRQLGKDDVVLKSLPPRRKVMLVKKPAS
ncbi:MAG: hypothetical protein GC165_11370 [Armatimonadetes bacterium]|nr:hypothetical protein [Armatimonadota bacterium]